VKHVKALLANTMSEEGANRTNVDCGHCDCCIAQRADFLIASRTVNMIVNMDRCDRRTCFIPRRN